MPDRFLQRGDKGRRVRLLQRRIKGREGVRVKREGGDWKIVRDDNGEAIGVKIDPGPIDGDFGEKTEEAVAQWEAMHGIDPDGKAGKRILRRLAPLRALSRIRRRRQAAKNLQIIPRARWNPAPPRGSIGRVAEPTSIFFDHCTEGSAVSPTASMDEEAARMKQIQNVAFSRGFLDISYSFVVFPSGGVWEGRGWDKSGAHTEGFNSTTYAIAACIPCAGEPVTQGILDGIVSVGRIGRKNGAMRATVDLKGHREVTTKPCPGDPIFNQNGKLQSRINAA